MNLLNYIILGVIQGITEFLPISSSAHLLIFKDFVNLNEGIFLDVYLHLATLLSIIFFYKNKIFTLTTKSIKEIKSKRLGENTKYIGYVVIGIIPVVIAGLFFEQFFENLRTIKMTCAMLVSIGVFMLFDPLVKERESKITFKKAVIIGLFQILALIPGASRSATTITTANFLKISKNVSVEYSFLMGIPIFIGAFLLKLKELDNFDFIFNFYYIAAFITAFLTGLVSIKFLISILNKYGFMPFAIYRIFLAIFLYTLF